MHQESCRLAYLLIVAPDAAMAHRVTMAFRALPGYEPLAVRDLVAAAALLRDNPYDLLVLEWGDDPSAAMSFVHRLRRGDWGNTRVPVLGVSEMDDRMAVQQALAVGIDDVIVMPRSGDEVLERALPLMAAGRELWNSRGTLSAL